MELGSETCLSRSSRSLAKPIGPNPDHQLAPRLNSVIAACGMAGRTLLARAPHHSEKPAWMRTCHLDAAPESVSHMGLKAAPGRWALLPKMKPFPQPPPFEVPPPGMLRLYYSRCNINCISSHYNFLNLAWCVEVQGKLRAECVGMTRK